MSVTTQIPLSKPLLALGILCASLLLGCDVAQPVVEGLATFYPRLALKYAPKHYQDVTLEGIVTVFHNDFFSYTRSGSQLQDGQENIDGQLTFEQGRIKTAQEAEGHGLTAYGEVTTHGHVVRMS